MLKTQIECLTGKKKSQAASFEADLSWTASSWGGLKGLSVTCRLVPEHDWIIKTVVEIHKEKLFKSRFVILEQIWINDKANIKHGIIIFMVVYHLSWYSGDNAQNKITRKIRNNNLIIEQNSFIRNFLLISRAGLLWIKLLWTKKYK